MSNLFVNLIIAAVFMAGILFFVKLFIFPSGFSETADSSGESSADNQMGEKNQDKTSEQYKAAEPGKSPAPQSAFIEDEDDEYYSNYYGEDKYDPYLKDISIDNTPKPFEELLKEVSSDDYRPEYKPNEAGEYFARGPANPYSPNKTDSAEYDPAESGYYTNESVSVDGPIQSEPCFYNEDYEDEDDEYYSDFYDVIR